MTLILIFVLVSIKLKVRQWVPVKGIFLEATSTDGRGLRRDRLWRLECPLPPAVAGLRLILRGWGGVGVIAAVLGEN